ncbi:(5-formylfuran-3-yl)methyl phosphate synthase [Planctomicrobium sp. SH668]|uniref:(5-formylfuran-3-yl)methyl phosphate synthase n=1 Tax=Planctomicrobium sp. SH668 TaxID=3448126 RepID=UPI003F5C88EE
MKSPPKLLVSVRNSHEAQVALEAGVDILDIKETLRGSLGRADLAVIKEITQIAHSSQIVIQVSAAWGELHEFAHSESQLHEGESIPQLSYIKMGLSHLKEELNWKSLWLNVRQVLLHRCRESLPPPQWIGVVYVDSEAAQSPDTDEILSAAIDTGCAGVLFDTFLKGSGSLLDHLSRQRLQAIVKQLHQAGLMVIAAGKVALEDVNVLAEAGVDVVAVRSAVCFDNNRMQGIDPRAIHAFNSRLKGIPMGQEHN